MNSPIIYLIPPPQQQQGSLEQQLSAIVSLQSQLSNLEAMIQKLRTLESTIISRKIAFNRHCTFTVEDIEKQVRDFASILTYKRPQLEQEIEYKKLKGVTPAQISEIESFFRQVGVFLSFFSFLYYFYISSTPSFMVLRHFE